VIAWDSLRFIVGDINYGGRVTDPWDRRLLLSLLGRFLSPSVLTEGSPLASRGDYRVPAPWGGLQEYRQAINILPMHDAPELLGMHATAEARQRRHESNQLLTGVISVQPRLHAGTSAGSEDPETQAKVRVADIMSSLPGPFSMEEAGVSTFKVLPNGLPDSLGTVLRHEMVKFNALLHRMSATLTDFSKALSGHSVMSEPLDAMYVSVMNDIVPTLWSSIAYDSLKPLGSWVRDLRDRVAFIRTWLRKGPPSCFWLSAFYFPHGFMTGVLQASARQMETAVDELAFSHTLLEQVTPEEVTSPPEHGVYVYGIYTEACRWDKLRRQLANRRLREPPQSLPIVHLEPRANYTAGEGRYRAPLYKTSKRAGELSSLGHSTNFIMAIDLPTDVSVDHWVQCGAALITQLDD